LFYFYINSLFTFGRYIKSGKMAKNPSSPYISNPERLADVIAAIQAMSKYKYYKLDFSSWAD